MGRTLKALGAFLALAVVLVGTPLLLLIVGRFDGIVSVDWTRVLTSPDDGRLLLGVLTLVAWFAWCVVALTIVFELIGVVTRGRVRIGLPGTSWLRPAVASLVLAVTALVISPNATVIRVTEPQTPLGGAVDVATTHDVFAVVDGPETIRHTIVVGDDLWSLAESYLGDGAKWRAIAGANSWLDPAAHLEAGAILKIPTVDPIQAANDGDRVVSPAAEPVLTAAFEPASPPTVVVAEGDTLWSIAERHLGAPERWPEIYDLNRDQIEDPDEIDIGWVLVLPKLTEAAAEPLATVEQQPAAARPVDNADSQQPTKNSVAVSDSLPAPSAEAPSAIGSDTVPTEAATTLETPSADMTWVLATGGVLACGLLTVLERHRLRQLRQRGLGRRIPPVDPANRRLEQALGRRAASSEPSTYALPTEVVLGWDDDGAAVTTDLERNRVTVVDGELDDVAGAIASISSSLLCSDWSDGVEQHLIGHHDCWAGQVDDPTVHDYATIKDGLDRLETVAGARRAALLDDDLATLRTDPDVADVWQPLVFLFAQRLSLAERTRVEAACADPIGVSAVLPGEGGDHVVQYRGGQAMLGDCSFVPQLISSPARHALIELFRAAVSEDTMPAPWWNDDDLPPNVTPLRRTGESSEEQSMNVLSATSSRHPTLLLLGPVELSQAAGELPTRSQKQCEEYCAWLLAYPGRTPTAMAADLLVAEPTRRSNMSRLRSWLGDDPDGHPYLPDAYSGRIQLHPGVTSDWEQFAAITAGGINRAPAGALRQALELVRGAPLADRAPWQWQWAEGLRIDMVSAIRDAAVVLAESAIEAGDIDLARWAVTRSSAAAPDDELLLATLALIEHQCGNSDEVKRIVMQLTRAARLTGVDLQERTVSMLQEVLEGRRRVRKV